MKISSLLYPDKCPLCDCLLSKGQSILCESCKQTGILRSSNQQEELSFLPEILHLYCPLQYAADAKESLIRYKFQGENWLAEPFAQLLHQTMAENHGYDHCTWITAVPVSTKRYKVRGYNQSVLIARKLSALSGIPYLETMARMDQKGEAQTGKMNRVERHQVKRFALLQNIPEINGGVILIDDILTTGSTLNECASLLLGAGADFINAAVVASGRRDLGGECA